MSLHSIHYLMAAICLYIMASCMACSKSSADDSTEKALCDSIVKSQYDTLFINPAKAVENLTRAERLITDSCMFYRIEMYKSLAHLFKGDERRMDSIRQLVAAFCHRQPDSRKANSLRSLYWNHCAVYLLNCGNRDSAIECLKHSLDALTRCDDDNSSGLIHVCINLADAYRQNGDAPQSSRYYRRALALSDSLRIPDSYMNIYSGLGQVYTEIENYDEANKYFERAGKLAHDSASCSDYDRYYFYISYGNSLYFQHRYDDALRAFKAADSIARILDNVEVSFITHINIGEVMLMTHQVDSASLYIYGAKEMFDKMPEDASKRFYMNSLLGDLELHRNNLSDALKYLNLASADSLGAGPRYRALHYKRMESYFSKRNDFRNAYRCKQLAQYFSDSINNEAVRNQIAEFDYRYQQDTARLHSNLIISQKDERMKEMQIQLYTLLIVLIIAASATTLWLMYKRRKRIMGEMKLKTLLYSQRLANMRNRITPHFMFNMLNRDLAISNESVNNLVRLLRLNLEMCDRYTVSLAEEIEFVDAYIDNEKPSLGDNVAYNKHIGVGVDLNSTKIPAMMLHIFVENAVKHGLRSLKGERFLDIDISHSNGATVIKVANNGLKSLSVNATDRTGTGIRVVTQTIQMLNDYNKQKIELGFKTHSFADDTQMVWTVTTKIPDGYNFAPFDVK